MLELLPTYSTAEKQKNPERYIYIHSTFKGVAIGYTISTALFFGNVFMKKGVAQSSKVMKKSLIPATLFGVLLENGLAAKRMSKDSI